MYGNIFDKLQNLFPGGLFYIFFETFVLLISYTNNFNSITNFLVAQTVAVTPVILSGIEIAHNIDFIESVRKANAMYRHCIIRDAVLMLIVFLSLASLKINFLLILFKWTIERIFALFIILYCIMGIELDRCILDRDIQG